MKSFTGIFSMCAHLAELRLEGAQLALPNNVFMRQRMQLGLCEQNFSLQHLKDDAVWELHSLSCCRIEGC